MSSQMKNELVRVDFPGTFGIAVEYNPAEVDFLRGKQLSDEDLNGIIEGMMRMGKEACVDVPSLGLDFIYDWSTGIDFGHEYEGGGYIFDFTHDAFYGPIAVSLIVEWHDAYTEQAGLAEERQMEETAFAAGVPYFNEFLSSL